MARRNDHTRDELKDMILEKSWKIVEKDSFKGLTARRIAREIGYVPGTIYNIFASMEDLYLHINSRTLDDLYEVLSCPECNSPKKTPVQNMKKMAQLYREFAKKNRSHWLMLFTHIQPEGQKTPDWYQEKISRLFEPLEVLLKPFYSKQQSRKRKMAARSLWGSVHGLCFLEETGKIPLVHDKASSMDMTSYLINNFVAGLEAKA